MIGRIVTPVSPLAMLWKLGLIKQPQNGFRNFPQFENNTSANTDIAARQRGMTTTDGACPSNVVADNDDDDAALCLLSVLHRYE